MVDGINRGDRMPCQFHSFSKITDIRVHTQRGFLQHGLPIIGNGITWLFGRGSKDNQLQFFIRSFHDHVLCHQRSQTATSQQSAYYLLHIIHVIMFFIYFLLFLISLFYPDHRKRVGRQLAIKLFCHFHRIFNR